ncbi:hypothetical protein KAR91_54435 [Candidatus Pacearchaeota archaeon]|nr:hypothetical protein [Candidatus Pacearchaeota archaeon]
MSRIRDMAKAMLIAAMPRVDPRRYSNARLDRTFDDYYSTGPNKLSQKGKRKRARWTRK